MSSFNAEVKTLSNGLRTVLLPRRDGETVTFMVLIGVGSRYETPKQSGLSHFLEHMFFKGTENRPTTREIAEAIDNVGGEFNAFTSEEYTGFYVKVDNKHLQRGADVVSDILLRPLFAPEEIEREKGVIVEEIRMYTDTPMRHVWHLWNEAMFGQHPLGQRIDGRPETVNSFSRKDFLNYTKKHYHTGNAVVAVAGKFNAAKVEKLLEELMAPLSTGAATVPKKAPRKAPAKRFIREHRASLDQTHLIVGAPGVPLSDERRWAAGLLALVLGGGMSSRLFLSIRERRGLAYAVRSMTENYTDTGMFMTQAGVRTDKAAEAMKIIMEEYDRVMQEPVNEGELRKVKNMWRGQLMIEMEETNSLAVFAGAQQLLAGKTLTPEEVLEKVEAVTAGDVQKVAQELLPRKTRAAVLLGPQKNARAFEKLLV